MRTRARRAIMAAAFMLLSQPALAQGEKASSPAEFVRRISQLKPGQWVWAPTIAPNGPILIYVDLSKQIALVYRNGVRIAASTISSGKSGYATPTGVFTILQKDAKHRSLKYNNAPMPFQQRLTWDGVALHAGGLPGYPESHGCVHLPYAFARELFGITNLGITVVVEGHAADHIRTSHNTLLAAFDARGQAVQHPPLKPGEDYRWAPQLSPQGPLTIIVSKLDQRVVVLRNGVEIGRSVAQIADDDHDSHVVSLTIRNGRPQWVYVGLPGHTGEEGAVLDEALMNRVQMPRGFYEQMQAAIHPGTTILITDSRVGANPPEHLTIMDATLPTR